MEILAIDFEIFISGHRAGPARTHGFIDRCRLMSAVILRLDCSRR